tara:strand:- start:212 stop:535 length:324 start_codon:yes stop_codon:yes gene_type:complete
MKCDNLHPILYHLRAVITGYGDETITYQLLLTFFISFLFGPFSKGILYYFIFIIFWEILFYFLCVRWTPFDRFIILISGLIGWFISRLLFLEGYYDYFIKKYKLHFY